MQPDAAAGDQAVYRAIDAWVRRLVDFSARNNLLYFRDLKTGTLDFEGMDPAQRDRFLAGEAVMFGKLLPPQSKEEAERRAKAMLATWRKALSNQEERGIQTLFLAHGMATWQDDRPRPGGEQARSPMSPILLYPVAIERAGLDGMTFSLRIAGEPQVNLVLLLALREWAGVELEPETLLESATGVIEPAVVFERLREAVPDLRGFDVLPRWVLGNFAFQKTALVEDLRRNPGVFAAHPLVRQLAGLQPGETETDPLAPLDEPRADGIDLDAIDPASEFLVLDADSSQHRVILKALRGANGVIQGPPGTGKSQVIVNLIASFGAEGKRVLFVAEKRAALEVVLNRLERLGLGHLAMDLHGADVSRKTVMERVARALETIRESVPVADEAIHAPFLDRRQRLVEHDERMHRPLAGIAVTPFDIIGQLSDLPPGLATTTRWRGAELAALTPERRGRTLSILEELGANPGLFLRDPAHAWSSFAIADGSAALRATDAVDELRRTTLPALIAAYRALGIEVGLPPDHSLPVIREAAAASRDWVALDTAYGGQLFTQDLDRLEVDLAAAEKTGIGGIVGRLLDGKFKAAKRSLGSLRTGSADAKTFLSDVRAARAARARWRALTTIAPPAEQTHAFGEALSRFDAQVAALTSTSLTSVVLPLATNEFDEWLGSLQSQRSDAARMASVVQLQHELLELGVPAFSSELRHRQAPPATWQVLFRHAFFTSAWEAACLAEPALASFDGRHHDTVSASFRELDEQRLKVAASRVRRAHAERAIETMNRFPEQDALVRREAQKKTRHLPLRTLVARAPDVLTSLAPCWMASPLSVSQLLDIERRAFDVVIFDEASQVLPEDAVCSLVRAQYAVVAGDSRQLPPTTFFATTQEEGEVDEEDQTGGFESLLDQLMAIVPEPWLLEWHYRSRDERLIAFSNAEVYNSRLVTFPGAGAVSPVRHVVVESDGDTESSSAEVRRVIELVFEHAVQHPDQSLGVIAMGIKHADRLQAAFDAEIARRSDTAGFFASGKAEPFFIKNLERVQGDERDAIILSVGYGKDASGKLPFRFGPLLLQGGERRLNVAITRARSSMTLVSSFTYFDMDPERCRGRRGLELLRGYLEFAAGGGFAGDSQHGQATGVVADIARSLREAGVETTTHEGASKYRIDLAIRERDSDGGGLAIETDGLAYHSGDSARDRDRLRPQQLERLGWTFHRTWSADWLRDPAAETKRILARLQGLPAEDETAPPSESPRSFAAVPDETRARGPRPSIGRRDSIEDYAMRELVELVAWIQSDGRLRTDEELMAEARRELGFERRGSRIDATLGQAIAWVRRA